MAEVPRRREEGSGSSRQGKPRRWPVGAPKTGTKTGGRVPAPKPRRPPTKASGTNLLRSRTRPAAGGDAPRGKSTARGSAPGRAKAPARGGAPARGKGPARAKAPARGSASVRGKVPERRTGGPGRPLPLTGSDAASRNGTGWLELVLSVVQAPVGMGRAQAERLVGELVRTGNLGQREAERVANEVRGASERAQGRAQSAADSLDRFIESRIEEVLNRINIPSRSDIERLNKSVDLLTAKVETLLGRHERSGH